MKNWHIGVALVVIAAAYYWYTTRSLPTTVQIPLGAAPPAVVPATGPGSEARSGPGHF
jgi:hypothetical protein